MPKFDPESPDKFFVKFKNHFKKLKAPFVIFKRLRATAGQGPNYVGPSCGYMLAYVGVCWPILRATWAHLVAMLAYVGLMLTHVEPKDPKNGNSKKTL